jgi:hypothetical protein
LEAFKASENADTSTVEIILITLLSKFKFSPTENEIIWNLSQIISPSVKGPDGSESEQKGLPLVVEIIEKAGF